MWTQRAAVRLMHRKRFIIQPHLFASCTPHLRRTTYTHSTYMKTYTSNTTHSRTNTHIILLHASIILLLQQNVGFYLCVSMFRHTYFRYREDHFPGHLHAHRRRRRRRRHGIMIFSLYIFPLCTRARAQYSLENKVGYDRVTL